MKVGILTFHFVYNYGAMLQSYALNQSINKINGTQSEIIDYRPRQIDFLYHPLLIDFYKRPKTILINWLKKRISHAKFNEFEEFINKKLILSEKIKQNTDFQNIVNQYDVVFVGSDQVWNPEITGYDENYLLKNIHSRVKKFSYAASLGKNNITQEWQESVRNSLLMFENLSVREYSGYKLLRKILPEKEVQQIPDPIFLFSKEEWKKNEKEMTVVSKYLLFYSLSRNDLLKNKTKELSEKEGLRIVSIHPLFKPSIGKPLCNIGPENFLWLIDHAEWICTDSFHATALSIIFEKKLMVKYDTENGNRIKSLLHNFTDKIISEERELGKYNFTDSKDKLIHFETIGKEYIKKSFDLS